MTELLFDDDRTTTGALVEEEEERFFGKVSTNNTGVNEGRLRNAPATTQRDSSGSGERALLVPPAAEHATALPAARY